MLTPALLLYLVAEATIPVRLFLNIWHRRSLPDFVKKKENTRPIFSQFPADIFQLHSMSITETFTEIMIKTLASCGFDLITNIIVSFFSLLSVIKAPDKRMICLCSNSWPHLLPKSWEVWVCTLEVNIIYVESLSALSKLSFANEASCATFASGCSRHHETMKCCFSRFQLCLLRFTQRLKMLLNMLKD